MGVSEKHVDADEPEEQTRAFLFTDLEGSTRSWQEDPAAMGAGLAAHDELLQAKFTQHRGEVFKHTGDGLLASFPIAADAVAAAVEAQRDLRRIDWGTVGRRRVRIAVHVGPARARGADWFGPTLSRAARVLGVIGGDQVVLTAPAVDQLPENAVEVVDLGLHQLRDISRPERLYAIAAEGLGTAAPTSERTARRLPRLRTAMLGRADDLDALVVDLRHEPLVSIVGPGGMGKTTLAVAAARHHFDATGSSAGFADLAEIADPEEVPRAVAEALGVALDRLPSTAPDDVAERIGSSLGDRQTLVVLDNCEHLLAACAEFTDLLLEAAPQLCTLATSREPLGVQGEVVMRLGPLDTSLDGAAVNLFANALARAGGPRELSSEQRREIADLCQLLDGMPLALEMAAAQAGHVPIRDLTLRLRDDLTALAGGRGRLRRQQTLEATIGWGYELLTDDERTLLRRLSVLAGDFDQETALAVARSAELEPDAIGQILDQLVERSFVIAEDIWAERPYRLLETVRAFGRERLRDAGEIDEVQKRHRQYFLSALADLALQTLAIDFAAGETVAQVDADVRAATTNAIEVGDLQLLADAFPAILGHATAIGWPADSVRAFEAMDSWLWDQPASQHARLLARYSNASSVSSTPGVDLHELADRAETLDLDEEHEVIKAVVRANAALRVLDSSALMLELASGLQSWLDGHLDSPMAPEVAGYHVMLLTIGGDLDGASAVLDDDSRSIAYLAPADHGQAVYLVRGRTAEALSRALAAREEASSWWQAIRDDIDAVAALASAGQRDEALGILGTLAVRAAERPPGVTHNGVVAAAAWIAWTDRNLERASELLATIRPRSDSFSPADALYVRHVVADLRERMDRDARHAAITRGSKQATLEAINGFLAEQAGERTPADA